MNYILVCMFVKWLFLIYLYIEKIRMVKVINFVLFYIWKKIWIDRYSGVEILIIIMKKNSLIN